MVKRNRQEAWGRNKSRQYIRRLVPSLCATAAAGILLGGCTAEPISPEQPAGSGASVYDNGSTNEWASYGGGSQNQTSRQIVAATIEGETQYVTSSLSAFSYDVIIVQTGIPVKWILSVPDNTLNPCNERILVPEYGIDLTLKVGDNLIEFTPIKTGKVAFTCWMYMIYSDIFVTEDVGIDPSELDFSLDDDGILECG